MPRRCVFLLLLFAAAAGARDAGVAKIKERELEEVRDRISALKQSLDAAAGERDRLSAELQEAEVGIAELRARLTDIERERQSAAAGKRTLEGELADRERHLDRESEALAAQLRTAYMSGRQEKIKLLLNQRDPATLGRLMAYYRYLNDYRAGN
ncbi:MAG: peptidase M23, partial [Proteobacteria bacterium]|nr:peptidase M23 [Pseudomonadota bacterium]